MQWASDDEYVEPTVQHQYAEVARLAQTTIHAGYDHQLGDRAVLERRAFLEERLAKALPR